MKKLFYTLFLALFALNLVSAQQYTAYFAFTMALEEMSLPDGCEYEQTTSTTYPYIYIVKHNGSGEFTFIGESAFLWDEFSATDNLTYIDGDLAETPMCQFYIFSNEDMIDYIVLHDKKKKEPYFEGFEKIENEYFDYAYKGEYNQSIFGAIYISYNYKSSKPIKQNATYSYENNKIEQLTTFTYNNNIHNNNTTETSIFTHNYITTIINSVTNYNINYFQWVSCPYDAELTVYVGATPAIYTYNGNSADNGTKPAFVLMKYNNDLENPWVDNGSAILKKGVGYILGIDNRGFSGTVGATYKSVNNINEIEKTFSHTLLENSGISSDRTDENIHLIGTGLFEAPKKYNFENGFALYLAIPQTNGNYNYLQITPASIDGNLEELAPHKAFFVQTTGNLTFDNNDISQSAPSLKRAIEQQFIIEEYNITLTGADFEEKTTILTNELGTEGYTIGEDFLYFHSSPNGDVANQFYSFDANSTLSFNHRANTTQTIRLGGQVAQDGRYTISLDGVNTKATSVILTDNVENTFVDLINENYTFDAHKGSISDRFTVTINYAPNTTVDTDVVTNSNGIVVVNSFEGCTIENLVAGEQMMIFDAMGRLVYNAPADANSVNLTLSAGTYIVRQNNNWAKFVIK